MAHCSLFMYGEKLQSNAGWIWITGQVEKYDKKRYNTMQYKCDDEAW